MVWALVVALMLGLAAASITPAPATAETLTDIPGVAIPSSPFLGNIPNGEYSRVYAIHLDEYQSLVVTFTPASSGFIVAPPQLYSPDTTSIWASEALQTIGSGDDPNALHFSYAVPSGGSGTYYLAVADWSMSYFTGESFTIDYAIQSPAASVTGFSAEPSSTSFFEAPPWNVSLQWTNPSDPDWAETVICRGNGDQFDPALGPDAYERVYEGTGTAVLDSVSDPDQQYSYGAYSVSKEGVWSRPTTLTLTYPPGGPNADSLPGMAIQNGQARGWMTDLDGVDVYRVPLKAGQTFVTWTYTSCANSNKYSDLMLLDVKLLAPEASSLAAPAVASAVKRKQNSDQWPTSSLAISGLSMGGSRGFPYVLTYRAPRDGLYHLVVRRTNSKSAKYLVEAWAGTPSPSKVTIDSAKMIATGQHGSAKYLDVRAHTNGQYLGTTTLQIYVGGKWVTGDEPASGWTNNSRTNFRFMRWLVNPPKLVWKRRYKVRLFVPNYGLATDAYSKTFLSK